ncbi:MAG: hypothetical protein IKZ02_04355, partial [Alphaproteobacteria bacterium]|nr:hypothetical protein [Alphaproteobacteria bacterium]
MFKRKMQETGRSMVEMLGVLAVIGVLSIAGIAGYRYAMEKYQANDIVFAVNTRIRDIWHRYQNKSLPDSFDEWETRTSTGYPIYIRSSLNGLTFSVDVDEVPNGVCASILNMRMDKILSKIIRVVPVGAEKESEEGVIFEESSLICQTYGEKSGIRFLASLESLNGEEGSGIPLDNNGDPTTYCYTKADCKEVIGRTCYDCVDNLCQPDCGSSEPYCRTENTTEPSCVKCLKNEHCAKGHICNEMTNTCQKVPEECKENEFRTYNGACMPCSTSSNIQIKDTPFEHEQNGQVVFRDSKSGKAMCEEQCADENKFVVETITKEGEESKMYCAYSCVDGYSYQANGGCMECQKATLSILPDNVEKAKDQCAACGGIWAVDIRDKTVCVNKTCEKGKEFLWFSSDSTQFVCKTCAEIEGKDANGYRINGAYYTLAAGTASDPSVFAKAKEYCAACGRKFVVIDNKGVCYTALKPGEEFMYDLGKGAPCSDSQKRKMDKRFPDAESLCTACGRTVEGDYCVPTCKAGEFKNSSGNCIPCNTTSTDGTIEVSNANECDLACTGENGIEKRFATTLGKDVTGTNKERTFCVKKCPTGQYVHVYGSCLPCNEPGWNAIGSGVGAAESCESCGNRRVSNRGTPYALCEFQSCKNGEFLNGGGKCVPCDSTDTYLVSTTGYNNLDFLDDKKNSCRACGRVVDGMDCLPICKETEGWYNSTKSCFTCDDISANTRMDVNGVVSEDFKNLCQKCGREVVTSGGQTHCKFKTGTCAANEFKNINGQCIPCSTGGSGDTLIVAQKSDCTINCNGQNGVEKRYATSTYTSAKGIQNYCVKDCPSNHYIWLGTCYSCDDKSGWVGIGDDPFVASKCEACGNRRVSGKGTPYALCEFKSCDSGYFLNDVGRCDSCSSGNIKLYRDIYDNTEFLESRKQSCIACSPKRAVANNMCFKCPTQAVYQINTSNADEVNGCVACGKMVIGNQCVTIEKGKKGVCNSYGNGSVEGYSAGNGIYFRSASNNFACESCSTDKAVYVGDDDIGREQCNSCGGNRQLLNGYCILGGCLSGQTFKTLNEGCQSCSFTYGKYEIAKNDSAECASECGSGKFVQQIGTGSSARYFCVNEPTDDHYF